MQDANSSMKRLDLTLPSIAENLALDEALLEQSAQFGDVLRFWESPELGVILGRASRVGEEVKQDYCRQAGIPILRRCSGGATVVVGPGCLMYAVVLRTTEHPGLKVVDKAHRFVLERLQAALRCLGFPVEMSGTSDLTLEGRKFSGNSLRCKKDALLYHGTILYGADLDRIAACLTMPPRQPEYRRHRTHKTFLVNLAVDPALLAGQLSAVWTASAPLSAWPQEQVQHLVRQRYACDAWNLSR